MKLVRKERNKTWRIKLFDTKLFSEITHGHARRKWGCIKDKLRSVNFVNE